MILKKQNARNEDQTKKIKESTDKLDEEENYRNVRKQEGKKVQKLRGETHNIETAVVKMTFQNIFKVSSISVALCSCY
jgi:hypothetical protein